MPKDILISDTNFDLRFEDGDLVIDESTRQHQVLLLMCEKGEFRESPGACLGITTWLNDDQTGDLNGKIKREMERDGMHVLKIRTKPEIQIEALYP